MDVCRSLGSSDVIFQVCEMKYANLGAMELREFPLPR